MEPWGASRPEGSAYCVSPPWNPDPRPRPAAGSLRGQSPLIRRSRRWPEGRERRRDRTRAGVKGETPLPKSARKVDFGMLLRGAFCDPRAGGCRTPNPNPWGSLRGLAPSCTRRRVPPSRRRGATLSRGEPTVLHCRRAPFSVGKRGVRYPFVPKAGRCRRRWVSSTQSFESRSARVPR